MKLHTRKIASGVALLAAAWGFASPASAAGGTVSYACQNGKTVNVRYQFNSAGIPTTAQAVLDGANRVMRYDMNSSDRVDTFFKDGKGYRLGSSYMDSKNYRGNSINVHAPDGEILLKSCSPTGGRSKQAGEARHSHGGGNSVSYVCQNGRRLNVRYQFNSAGIPIRATANVQGRNHTLSYNQGASDNVDTVFTGRGYRLSGGYIDSGNFRSEGGLILTAPNSQILYKNCNPAH